VTSLEGGTSVHGSWSGREGAVWFRDRDRGAAQLREQLASRCRQPLVDRFLASDFGNNFSRRFLEPRVKGRVMVLTSRHAFGRGQNWPGLFSEFHSVLGALTYATERHAAGVRVAFDAPNYVQPGMSNNWWEYFFERSVMSFTSGQADEVHLTRALARYGRFFGFGGIVYGPTPFLYPMTFGVARSELAGLVSQHVAVRNDIRQRVDDYANLHFSATPFTLGIHYRGTDTSRHFPYYKIPYESFVIEAHRVLESVGPSDFRLFVACDEAPFLEFIDREFGGRVLCWDASPRVGPDDLPPHLADKREENYAMGESAVIDCLLLSRADYLIKARSNLSDASLVFNAELPYSFCIR
jgi:hypothetical protein